MHGVAADRRRRRPQLDVGQPRRAPGQRLQGDLQAGRDCAAEVLAGGVDGVEGGAGAEVDDARRRAVVAAHRGRVDHAVGAHVARAVVAHLHAGLDTSVHHQRRTVEHPLRQVGERGGERRHHAREGHAVDRRRVEAGGAEQPADQHFVLLGGGQGARLDAPARAQFGAVEHAEHDVAVAYVDAEQHADGFPIDAGRARGSGTEVVRACGAAPQRGRRHVVRQRDVVDEPYALHAGGQRQQGAWRVGIVRQLLQAVGIGEAQVFEFDAGSDDRRARQAEQRVPAPLAAQPGAAGGQQAAIQRRGAPAAAVAQQLVAGTQREAVGGAHGGAADDGDRQPEIVGQAAHHGELLGVLAAEVGAPRREQQQQLGDHRRDAGEMIMARGPLQWP